MLVKDQQINTYPVSIFHPFAVFNHWLSCNIPAEHGFTLGVALPWYCSVFVLLCLDIALLWYCFALILL